MVLSILGLQACSSTQRTIFQTSDLQTYEVEQVEGLLKEEARPLVVFLHADWCKFCENMKQTTLRHAQVVQTLNRQFYFVSFDGEQSAPVDFAGQTFSYRPNGRDSGTHELALELGTVNGELSYPTLTLLNPNYEIIFQHSGFLKADEVLDILERAR